MPIGPQLPTASEKRKRDEEDGESSEDGVGPTRNELAREDANVKRARVLGPTLPPAPLDERPPTPGDDTDGSEDSSDDDFGPRLPSASTSGVADVTTKTATSQPTIVNSATAAAPSKRDEWMTLAPTNGDWSSRVDPTKLKNRKFNTGKSAGVSAASNNNDAWHETPEQKQARIHNEMLGIKDESSTKIPRVDNGPSERDIETAKRIKEYNAQRGPSLYDKHQQTKEEQDDDPSARAFDREKDIAGGLKINSTQRRDMLKKASDFNSRFSGAKYL